MLQEGWYLMSTASLERELIFWRTSSGRPAENVQPLTIEEALAFRNAGNVPDELERTLRLVLHVNSDEDLQSLDRKRLAFEPDYLDAPTWRREGSKPVNVVPLRPAIVDGTAQPWWENDATAELEGEWQTHGTAAGLKVPGDYRGFVFKTVLALQNGGREVTVDSVCDAIARWVSPDQVEEIRTALRNANS